MNIGDIVVRKSYGKDIMFKVIDIKKEDGKEIAILKGLNIRIIADSKIEDLERAPEKDDAAADKILNKKVKEALKKAEGARFYNEKSSFRSEKSSRAKEKEELKFGRPGRILHVDGDSEYMETCLKVYKQLNLEAVGRVVPENEQPDVIVDLVKELKPDIVVLTGHDSIFRDAKNYLDLDSYRNSKYFIESVKNLRDYNSSYDELIIFAGACQSCYEKILEAGANFASSPSRVLIHCLDPVFVCEKIAYTRIDKIVSITDVIDSTITGIKGVGGIQTRGKYREGFPKSMYM